MKVKTLTTTKAKLQAFYNTDETGAKQNKNARMEVMKNSMDAETFEEKFWGKKYSLLDEVIFKTVNEGVYHCLAESIRTKCKVGKTTLAEFNRNLKTTNQFIVARYRKAICNFGSLVYIDTKHKNFYENMMILFDMDKVQVDTYLSQFFSSETQNETQNEPQKFSETVGAVSVEGENSESNYINLNNLKQSNKNNIYNKPAIESDDVIKTKEEQDALMITYAKNQYQTILYNHIQEMPFPQMIKDYAYKIALKAESKEIFFKAKNTLQNLALDLCNRTIVLENASSIVKVFAGALNKALNYKPVPPAPKRKTSVKKAPLYNWLEEREPVSVSVSVSPLYNWIDEK